MAAVSPESTQSIELSKRHFKVNHGDEDASLRMLSHKSWTSLLIFPDDKLFQLWTAFVIFILTYCTLITPYRIAFIDLDTIEWIIADTTIDVLFAIDLLFNCVLVYHDEERNLVTSHCEILKHYAKSWMIWDFVACFPLHLILSGETSIQGLSKLTKFSRIYKIVRMFRLVRMLKLVKSKNHAIQYLNTICRINASLERLFWFVLTLILTLHLMACSWAFVGRYSIDTDPNNWITINGFQELDGLPLYIVSMYWTVTTVATVGYGDITACNEQEMIVNSCIMLVGVFTYSYMIGSLTNVISSLDSRKSILNHKLEILWELGQEYKLNKSFIEKLSRAVEYDHKNTNKEVDELVASLPSSLKNQLLVSIYHRKIEGNTFFEGRSEHFVAWVVPFLKPIRFDEEEIVTREGDLAQEMYFLIKGEVEFVLDKGTEYICYVSVSPGYYFGEIELLINPQQTRLYTVRTSVKTDLLSLVVERFEELLKLFRNEALEILSLVQDRKTRIDDRKHMAEQDYNAKKSVSRHHSIPLNIADRKERAENLKKAIEEDASSSGTDEEREHCEIQISLLPDRDAAPGHLARLNTFGDAGHIRVAKKQMKGLSRAMTNGWSKAAEKLVESKRPEISNRDVMKNVRKLEAKIDTILTMMSRGYSHELCFAESKLSLNGRRESIHDEPPSLSEADERSEEISDVHDSSSHSIVTQK